MSFSQSSDNDSTKRTHDFKCRASDFDDSDNEELPELIENLFVPHDNNLSDDPTQLSNKSGQLALHFPTANFSKKINETSSIVLSCVLDLLVETVTKNNKELHGIVLKMVTSELVKAHVLPASVLTGSMTIKHNAYKFLLQNFLAASYNYAKIHTHVQSDQQALSLTESPSRSNNFERNNVFMHSRFQHEFAVIKHIGNGGFGKVMKARYLTDDQIYAVKRIPFNYTNDAEDSKRFLHEVRTLARMEHPNIVRYYTSWVEVEFPVINARQDVNHNANLHRSTAHVNSKYIAAPHNHLYQLQHTPEMLDEESNLFNGTGQLRRVCSSPSIAFTVDDGDREKLIERKSCSTSVIKTSELLNDEIWRCTHSDDASSCQSESGLNRLSHFSSPHRTRSSLFLPKFVVHIQMGPCDGTLNDLLNQRNSTLLLNERLNSSDDDIYEVVDRQQNANIIFQLLCAIDYIHSMGVIHRDIKPSNIFYRMEGDKLNVKLGDFGLACLTDENILTRGETMPSPHSHGILMPARKHSCGVGTRTYSAPEQLNKHVYSPAVDIFSLGIVTYELYRPFKTSMEKHKLLFDARLGQIDEKMSAQFTHESDLIKECLAKRACNRPTASQLLARTIEWHASNPLSTSHDLITQVLRARLRDKTEEVEQLKSELNICKEFYESQFE